jgi:REP element-mobilizing transposase RayT
MLPERKPNRLPTFDYAQNGAYFLTICTKNRACLFWDQPPSGTVGERIALPQEGYRLSGAGELVRRRIEEIPEHYPAVSVDRYVIMPNHVHLLLQIEKEDDGGRAMRAPTVSTLVCQWKGSVSKDLGEKIWQRSFHDHVVRNARDYAEIWRYIDNNPRNWIKDTLFPGDPAETKP